MGQIKARKANSAYKRGRLGRRTHRYGRGKYVDEILQDDMKPDKRARLEAQVADELKPGGYAARV